jgi:hypothetical protein
MLKFFLDTHIPKAVALQLRGRGVDALRCEEVGMAEASDDELLAFATKEGRAMVSIDADFLRLSEGINHAGIFRIPSKYQDNVGKIVTELYDYFQLIDIQAGTVAEDIHNQVIWIR